jgi:hypothetical protein
MYVSSNRLTRRSSRSRSSNEEMGARKIIASMSSKYGYQRARCRESIRRDRGKEREEGRSLNLPKIWSHQHHTLTIHGRLQSGFSSQSAEHACQSLPYLPQPKNYTLARPMFGAEHGSRRCLTVHSVSLQCARYHSRSCPMMINESPNQ